MQDERKPLLNKKPFWIADAVLVIAALIIAFTGEPGLTPMESVWFVFLMALGVCALIAPYYLEFVTYAKLHQFEHDQASWERVQKLDTALAALAEARTQLENLSLNADSGQDNNEALASLETRLGVMERHITDLQERSSSSLRAFNQSFVEQLSEQKQMVETLTEKFDILATQLTQAESQRAPVEAADPTEAIESSLFPIKATLETQGKLLTSLQTSLKTLQEREEPEVNVSADTSALESLLADRFQHLETTLEGLQERLEDYKTSTPQTPRSQYGRSSLISKAFGNTPASENPSVIERIINPHAESSEKSEFQQASEPPETEEDSEPLSDATDLEDSPETEPEDATEAYEDNLTETNEPEQLAEAESAEIEPELEAEASHLVESRDAEDFKKEPEVDESEDAFFAEKRPTLKDFMSNLESIEEEAVSTLENSVNTHTVEYADTHEQENSDPASNLENSGAVEDMKTSYGMLDLDILDKPKAEKKTTGAEKDKLGQTRISVHALIGIGNKPYLRGDGPGLSWERGVAMDFVEIGKWEWKTMRAHAPFKYQVWLNDQKKAEGEPQIVEPGIGASVSPRFPT